MPALRIPPEHQKGLAKLISLPPEQAEEFLKSVESAAKKVRSDRFSSDDLRSIPGVSPGDLSNMLDTLLALYHVRHHADVSTDEFVSDVTDSLKEGEGPTFGKEELPGIKKRLTDFLSLETLSVEAKASVLRYEHERTLHDVRILTDARPVFGEDVSAEPHAAVIFHMLKIEYHASKGVEEVYFSLDEHDLEYLKQVIIRAEKKAKSLREALSKSEITTINP